MDELTRFARQLAERLAQRPEGAQRPISVAEIREHLLPYRAERRTLGLASVEDYETVLLRLVAEERGYVRTLPAAAAERCREELAQSNPDLGVLEEIADSRIQVTSLATSRPESSHPEPEKPPSHPEPATLPRHPEPAPPARDLAPSKETPRPARDDKGSARDDNRPGRLCPHCHKQLPGERTASFCPWCGERLIPLTCTRCGTELESQWRHCITCGSPVQDPVRTS